MKAEEIERCPKCGAYCFPAKHSSDACAQIEKLYPQIGQSDEAAAETKFKQ